MIAVTLLSVCLHASTVAAQPTPITGMLSGHLGVAAGGDTDNVGLTPAASVAVIESNGWGAEIDLGHTWRFAGDAFAESGITTLMVNVIGLWTSTTIRPFGTAGVGLLRVHAALADGDAAAVNRTDWGFNAGGGVLIMLDDKVGVRGDLRYLRYFQRHPDLPMTDSGFFDFWRTSIGVTWTWPIR